MNGVPLAIEQARAMIKHGIPIGDFLGHFESQYQRIMAHKPPKSAWDYEKNMSIISIFNMLLARLDKDDDAKNILAFASCFGSRHINVNLLGQDEQARTGSTGFSFPIKSTLLDLPLTWLSYFGDDRLALQLAISHLESLCLLKLKKNGAGNTLSISLHDSISRWRFETMENDRKEKWILAAAYASSNHMPQNMIDQESQMRSLPLIRHFYHIIRR